MAADPQCCTLDVIVGLTLLLKPSLSRCRQSLVMEAGAAERKNLGGFIDCMPSQGNRSKHALQQSVT